MNKHRISALIIIIISVLFAVVIYKDEINAKPHALKLGLDLSGGTHLVYKANITDLPKENIDGSLASLRDVVERRVNVFGVSEPLVQIETANFANEADKHRLIVELPGVTDVEQAVASIGRTPLLEFKLLKAEDMQKLGETPVASTTPEETAKLFVTTGLTGRLLDRAAVNYDQTTGDPHVLIAFNEEGKKLFAEITRTHVNDILAIFLDGAVLSLPTIREEITSGEAVISGNFQIAEARSLVRDLNYGALPVPIELVSTETIGATLGDAAVRAGIVSGFIAFIAISIFLIFWYRLPGLVAVIALFFYTLINFMIFKYVPVTLTAAGIAGFILSLGMAVDANILIFERMKEELRKGKRLQDALDEGFKRAWASIRDSNLSSIITAAVLFYFAGTPIIKGFALVFFIGVITSMISSITVSRTLLRAIVTKKASDTSGGLLFGVGFKK